jgi:REP element-mobilizing transposase RayT
MFLTKNANGGKISPHQKCQIIKGRGKATLVFFTLVTYQRRPILCLEESRSVLREVIGIVCGANPFSIEAWVLLPDHMHCMWRLLEGDTDYSLR